MSWLNDLIVTLPPDRKAAILRAAGRVRPNSAAAGTVNPGRAGAASRRIATRNMHELIGMCRMVLADGALDNAEARVMLDWIEANFKAVQHWPGNVLYERIAKAMIDGKIDADEEGELLEVIHKVSGGAPRADAPRVSGAVPFDDPAPSIIFPERTFVVTGQFVFGTRKQVSAAIVERGGEIGSTCSRRTHYLIIGTYASDEWLHSTHGTKIAKAVELKRVGLGPAIISERHWTESL